MNNELKIKLEIEREDINNLLLACMQARQISQDKKWLIIYEKLTQKLMDLDERIEYINKATRVCDLVYLSDGDHIFKIVSPDNRCTWDWIKYKECEVLYYTAAESRYIEICISNLDMEE